MGSLPTMKNVALLPMGATAAAVVILLGTMVGQAGHDEGNEALVGTNPMAGMNMPGMDHGGGAAAGPDMAGMDMSGKDAGMDMTGKDAGMDMSQASGQSTMPGMSPAEHAAMSDGTAPSTTKAGATKAGATKSAAPMSMRAGMAAQMPGGVHATCAAASCTVIFAKGASGSASLLGAKTRLIALSPTSTRLRVGGHEIVLRGRKAVRYDGLTFKITRISGKEVWVHVARG